MRGKAGATWTSVLGLLLVFWVLIHGPQLPGPMPIYETSLEKKLLGVGLGSAFMLLLAWIGLRVGPQMAPPAAVPFRMGGSPRAAYVGAVMAVLGVSLSVDGLLHLSGLWGLGELGEMEKLFGGLEARTRWAAALFVAVLPGLCEEACFRGWLLSRIAEVSGVRVGIAVSSVVFGLFHFDPLHILATIPLGFVLGFSAWRSSGLGPPVLAHAVNNFVSVVSAGTPLSDALRVAVALGGAALGVVGLRCLATLSSDQPVRGS